MQPRTMLDAWGEVDTSGPMANVPGPPRQPNRQQRRAIRALIRRSTKKQQPEGESR